MGHNDGGDLAGTKRRGSLKGIGDEQQQITLPDGHQELVHTYGWYIRHYIDDTRGEQANPILLSLTIRNIWKPDSTVTPASSATWATMLNYRSWRKSKTSPTSIWPLSKLTTRSPRS